MSDEKTPKDLLDELDTPKHEIRIIATIGENGELSEVTMKQSEDVGPLEMLWMLRMGERILFGG